MEEATAKKWAVRAIKTGQLPEIRERVGLSQGDVARALGLNQSSISRWESGKAWPRGGHALQLRRLLEADE
jgi:DNA-binding transcriptional regulator YiaG